MFPTLDGLGRDVEHPGEDVVGYPAFEPELRQFFGPDLRRPVGHFEGSGLEGNLALGVENRFLEALADLVRNRQPLPFVFRVRSSPPPSTDFWWLIPECMGGAAGLTNEKRPELPITCRAVTDAC
jgi:hypothetical protein